jgi:hypothetical protein
MYDRQVEHNQTLVAKFSDIMRTIGDINLIKYTPGIKGDGSIRTPGWGSYTDGEVEEFNRRLAEYVALKATLRNEMEETALDLASLPAGRGQATPLTRVSRRCRGQGTVVLMNYRADLLFAAK